MFCLELEVNRVMCGLNYSAFSVTSIKRRQSWEKFQIALMRLWMLSKVQMD
jgi:hypothetical protein